MLNNTFLASEARAWVKRKHGPDEVVQIVLDIGSRDAPLCYDLYTAYQQQPEYLGRILFDMQGYWIYDGDSLTIAEQEQLAKFIGNYVERI